MDLTPIFHAPSVQEMARRRERVQAEMARQGLDWYVASHLDNVYYLTNFATFPHERPFIALVPASGPIRFLVPGIDAPHVAEMSIGDHELVVYREYPAPAGQTWADEQMAVLKGARRVGVESMGQIRARDAVPGETVVTDIVEEVRFIKSDYDVGRLAYANMVASEAMADLLANAAPGRTLGQVREAGTAKMFNRLYADDKNIVPQALAFASLFHPASHSHDPHNFGNLEMAMAEGGPHVSIMNAVMNGYGAEIERTFFLGHVPEEAKRKYEVMMEARRISFEMTVPGNLMSDVDKAVRRYLDGEGMLENVLSRTGHGMGATAHEGPFLAEGYDVVIEPRMCFTLEPGIYFPGLGGFRHSDTILTTEDGNVSLTYAPDSLEDMTL
ncbi:Xaa-Pro peptidase family protein [uncultured Maritimibacter sp.]|jgi:Xaa-Pro dipeptidase|uniref:M24 family metallopeptidase n=1 Tax=uncultured Maritimibacter sp. TaxID=991866 RepID=UPI000AB4B35A|nr:Xaa-Pro peptidase family protein [uncultured Maritimibacter sp.]